MYLHNELQLKGDVFFNMLMPNNPIFTFQIGIFFFLPLLLFTDIQVGTIATGLQQAGAAGE